MISGQVLGSALKHLFLMDFIHFYRAERNHIATFYLAKIYRIFYNKIKVYKKSISRM